MSICDTIAILAIGKQSGGPQSGIIGQCGYSINIYSPVYEILTDLITFCIHSKDIKQELILEIENNSVSVLGVIKEVQEEVITQSSTIQTPTLYLD